MSITNLTGTSWNCGGSGSGGAVLEARTYDVAGYTNSSSYRNFNKFGYCMSVAASSLKYASDSSVVLMSTYEPSWSYWNKILYNTYGLDNVGTYVSCWITFANTITFTGGTDVTNPDLIAWCEANYELVSTVYSVSATINPASSGTVSGTGSYLDGNAYTVTATPASGYTFANWTDTRSGKVLSTSTTYSSTNNREQQVYITANFIANTKYNVSAINKTTSGSFSSSSTSYDLGSSFSITAPTKNHFTFEKWTDKDGNTVSTDTTYTGTSSTSQSLEYDAVYTPDMYIANAYDLQIVADAIKTKRGLTDTITFPNEFVGEVNNLVKPTGNINLTSTNSTDVTNYATAQVVDSDLVATNIKKDVNILGVTGTYEPSLQTKSVTPTTSAQTITPDSSYDGLSSVSVGAVTSSIDANIIQSNIKLGVSILGVAGNLEPDKPDQTKTCTPTTSQQVIQPDTGYELASVTVSGVTSDIDANIVAGNIKKDIAILGVTGTFEGSGTYQSKTTTVNGTVTPDAGYDALSSVVVNVQPTLQSKSATPTTSSQTISPDSGYDGLSSVSISAVTSSIDANIVAGNIKKDVVILGVTGTHEGGITPTGSITITTNTTTDVSNYATAVTNVQPTLQSKTATANGTVTPDSGYDGLSSVVVSIPTYDDSSVELYSITPTLTNVTASASNESYIEANGTLTLTYTADGTSYKVPTTAPTVTGATSVYVRTSDTECSLTLSNPTGDVSFTVSGESAWEYPTQSGEELTVTQTYSSAQSSGELTIQ